MVAQIQPTADAQRIIEAGPGLLAQSFRALVSCPQAGVTISTISGEVVFANDQAARMLLGGEAKAAEMIARPWQAFMPPEWAEERLRLINEIVAQGRPVFVRTLWRDYQQYSWIYPISAPEVGGRVSGVNGSTDGAHGPGLNSRETGSQPLFLSIKRRAAGDEEREALRRPEEYIEVDSAFVRLVRLAPLSPRELEVLALLGQGLSVKETAGVLFRSEKTIERHRDAIHSKLDISDRAELVKIATRAGLTLADAERRRI